MTKGKSIFEQFTGKYELSKTLRFELKPVGKTEEFLKANKVFEKDKLIDDHYHQIKYYFDTLHREFIHEALRGVSFSTALYEKYCKAIEQLKAAKKEDKRKEASRLKEIEAELREKLVERFDEKAREWKKILAEKGIELKQESVDILFEEGVLAVLKEKFQNAPSNDPSAPSITFINPLTNKKENLFDSFKGFYTYFSNFNETKRNLYTGKDQDAGVANRAISENLHKFIENIIQFNEYKDDYLRAGFTADERKIFKPEFYNQCFIQEGIDTYNRVVGGVIGEDGGKIKGINEKINLYNQQHKDKKLRQFTRLFKQILSKKDNKERFAEIIEDNDVFPALREFVALNGKKLKGAKSLMSLFFNGDGKYNISQIYVKGAALNTISSKWFSNWAVVGGLLRGNNRNKRRETGQEETENAKLPDFIPFAKLKEALEAKSDVSAKDLFQSNYENLYKKTNGHFQTFLRIWEQEWRGCIEVHETARRGVESMMTQNKSYRRDDEKQAEKIKTYCDAALGAFRMMKYFALEKGRKQVEPEGGADAAFYNPFNEYYQDCPIPAYYNEFRNCLTKKAHLGRLLFPSLNGSPEQRHPLSKRKTDGVEKIKLNFENGVLLSGWAIKKEPDCYGVIFRKNDKFLLGIMTKECHDLFKNPALFSDNDPSNNFAKMEYRQLNKVFRQLPHIAFAERNKEKYRVTRELEQIREDFKKFQGMKKKDKKIQFDKGKLQKLIGLYKKVLHDSFGGDFEFGALLDRQYDSLNDFFSTVERTTYSLKFIPTKRDYVDTLVADGKMALFDITNKDFKKQKPSADNLHTSYFKALFEVVNLASPVLKLSGGAEVFFRPGNDQLNKKKDNKGKSVIDHKRYSEDKIFLHLPIVLNMGAGGDFGFNGQINKMIAQDKEQKIKVIGIDRGEKHLAYFALIDQGGKLLKSGNLDGELPNGSNYLKKLEERAGRRDESRKEWKTIENIKELKNGYISWVVRKLSDLMLDENAVLVFEDLTVGFKRGRQKVEKQVYQKLELALIQKLNYLVRKDSLQGVSGHYLRAYQLAPQVQTPQDIGKQCGAVFYVSPWYTSLTCPQCGYRKNISFPFESIAKAKILIKKINLCIASHDGGFTVAYTLSDEEKGATGTFEISSKVQRVRWHWNGTDYARNHRCGESVIDESKSKQGVAKQYDITACLKGLFEDKRYGIGVKSVYTPDDLTVSVSPEFYRNLFRYLDLMLRSRNSISGTDTDYIQCARCLFHSDRGFQGHQYNGDANGAYNIARKGLLALRKIQKAENPEMVKWGDLRIDVVEWDKEVDKWRKKK